MYPFWGQSADIVVSWIEVGLHFLKGSSFVSLLNMQILPLLLLLFLLLLLLLRGILDDNLVFFRAFKLSISLNDRANFLQLAEEVSHHLIILIQELVVVVLDVHYFSLVLHVDDFSLYLLIRTKSSEMLLAKLSVREFARF